MSTLSGHPEGVDTAALAAKMLAVCRAEGQARRVLSEDDAATMRRNLTPRAG